MYILSHFTAPTNLKGEENKQPWVAPFWSVVSSTAQYEKDEQDKGPEKAKAPSVMFNKASFEQGATWMWNTNEMTKKREKSD